MLLRNSHHLLGDLFLCEQDLSRLERLISLKLLTNLIELDKAALLAADRGAGRWFKIETEFIRTQSAQVSRVLDEHLPDALPQQAGSD